ncbi:hypothetical protein RSal33209_0931 [Renibacterium salmoninarum ATCC 33209]|uniref:Uncharacterized protein n=1 Tax=Renibacterium salmoninarum (strain ATCC 33209 / DSM 20767 / JCM 11484 / NBRC 15589 / NCIMB 2235) TaxID=288705 RepID=A9WNE4_RENSM|nr:hypothetical protein RSal33209_0931 [Renibacterium salmoninarum ATCC 33209]
MAASMHPAATNKVVAVAMERDLSVIGKSPLYSCHVT